MPDEELLRRAAEVDFEGHRIRELYDGRRRCIRFEVEFPPGTWRPFWETTEEAMRGHDFEAVANEIRRRLQEYLFNGVIDEVRKRAMKLLERQLTDEQRKRLADAGCFEAVGSSGKTFRIYVGLSFNVWLLDNEGREAVNLCAYPHGVPEGDAMLAQLLMIQTDDPEYLRRANKNPQIRRLRLNMDSMEWEEWA